MNAAPKEQGGARVTEVVPVPVDRGEARATEQRLEVAVDYVLGVQRGALARGKNQP